MSISVRHESVLMKGTPLNSVVIANDLVKNHNQTIHSRLTKTS